MSIAISVSDLSKIYGQASAVSHATFEVPKGTVCGFVSYDRAASLLAIYIGVSALIAAILFKRRDVAN